MPRPRLRLAHSSDPSAQHGLGKPRGLKPGGVFLGCMLHGGSIDDRAQFGMEEGGIPTVWRHAPASREGKRGRSRGLALVGSGLWRRFWPYQKFFFFGKGEGVIFAAR